MLTNSFIHMPKIGATTERKIWDSGIKSWDEFTEGPHHAGLPESKLRSILEGINTSKEKLNVRDHTYFANNLPKKSTGRHTGNSGNTPFSWISRPPDFPPIIMR